MKTYLGIFSKFMDPSYKNIRLLIFNSIQELDKYTGKFNNSEEIKKEFSSVIEEFVLESYANKKYKETKNGKPITYLSAYIMDNGNLRFIPILYKNDKIIKTGQKSSIKERLLQDEYFKKLLKKYYYLLSYSSDMKTLIYRYKHSGSKYYKKIIVNELMSMISRLNDDYKYFYIRVLCNICNLVEKVVVTEYGTIENIDISDEEMVLVRKRIADDCTDERFIKLVTDEDYENLFNEYSIEDIVNYSSDSNNPLKVRRK